MTIHPISPYSTEKNIGQAYNRAIALVPDTDWVLLLDMDVMLVTPLEPLYEAIKMHPGAGIFTCYTTRCGYGQQCYPKLYDETSLFTLASIARDEYEKPLRVRKLSRNLLSGYFMAFSKKTWMEVGGFKSEWMLGVDDNFSTKVAAKGKGLYLIENLLAIHYYRMVHGRFNTSHLK